MINELNQTIQAYLTQWQTLVAARKDKAFFEGLKPTAVGWKTVDQADFDKCFAELKPHCDQIHLGWVNERWIATMHLKNQKLDQGIQLIKLMQLRPGSSDATGLDHLDFYSEDKQKTKQILTAESDLKWTEESNGHCEWLSLWFEGTEAKLRNDTTLDICIQELEETKTSLFA